MLLVGLRLLAYLHRRGLYAGAAHCEPGFLTLAHALSLALMHPLQLCGLISEAAFGLGAVHSTKCSSRDWRCLSGWRPARLLGQHRVQLRLGGSSSSPAQFSLGSCLLSPADCFNHPEVALQFAHQSPRHSQLDLGRLQRIQRLHFTPVASWPRRSPPPGKATGLLRQRRLHSSLRLGRPVHLG